MDGAGVTEIILEGQWTRSECFRAIRLSQSWWPESVTAVGVAIVALIFRPHILWALGGGALVIAMTTISFWAIPGKFWNQGIGTQEPRRSTINDDGIRTKSSSLEIFLEWSRYSRSRETREFYFLRFKRNMFATPIRKASFQTTDDEAFFRSLLRAHTVAKLKTNALLDPAEAHSPSTPNT
jgi:hypothetical protein